MQADKTLLTICNDDPSPILLNEFLYCFTPNSHLLPDSRSNCQLSMHVKFNDKNGIVNMAVAHGRVVTSSRQITEVKQCQTRLLLGWMSGARVTLPTMCRGVWQASHIMLPLSTQQWWVPGGTENGELQMALAAENALNFPQRRWYCIRESSNTRGVNCEVCGIWWDIRL